LNTIHFSPADFAGARHEELLRHVEEHKYLTNQTIPYEISLEEAFESWMMLVHGPLSEAIEEEGLAHAFPQVGKGELFLWVSRHWHYMKQNDTVPVTVREAVLDFGTRFAPDAVSRFGFFLKKVAA
jgi:hypothetical protein